MRTRRRILIPLMAVLALFALAPSASASTSLTRTPAIAQQAMRSGNTSDGPKSRIVRGTVEWTIPADQCASLPAGVSVTGTGKRFQVITTRTFDNGSSQIIDNDFVEGTAVDSAGQNYHFIYANQANQQVPRRGSPISVNMTDSFILTNDSNGNAVVVAFIWRWRFTPPAESWPPADNWRKDYTYGDPFTCDPI